MNAKLITLPLSIFLLSLTTSAQTVNIGRTYEFDNIAIPADPGTGFVWEVQTDFSDDFEYTGKADPLFTNVWDDTYNPDPGFRGPGETTWVTGNSDITGGNLELRGTPGAEGRVNCGVISSSRTITYPVYMESRIKVADIENSSNFWLLNGALNDDTNRTSTNEIDILEVYGGAADNFFSTQMSTNFHVFERDNISNAIITDNTYQVFFRTNPNPGQFWRDDFHTFGVYWKSPTDITFYIDGVARTNGQHYVTGRQASNLDGSYEDAILQSPRPADGKGPIDKSMSQYQLNQNMFIILDTESHEGRPISPLTDLNDPVKNVTTVDWVRVYKPVSDGTTPPVVEDRTRQVTLTNRASFIPNGGTLPQFDLGQEVSLSIDYATGITNEVEEDLFYVAVQVREVDETGTPVATSPFTVAVSGEEANTGSVNFSYTIPTEFSAGVEIPTSANLEAGHRLLLLIFMSVDSDSGFVDANGEIVLVEPTVLSVNDISADQDISSVYPNPSSDVVTIQGDFKSWELYSIYGSAVAKGDTEKINISNLTEGIYYLVLDNKKQAIKVVKK